MSNRTDSVYASIMEDSGATCLARIYGNAGAVITQASLTAITCKVFDVDSATPDAASATPAVVVTSAVFDTLQTDAIWTKDTTGYNFKFTVPATAFPTGGHRYEVEFLFDPVTGEDFYLPPFILYAKPVRST